MKQTLQPFKVAIISESAGNWPVYVGLEKKFFETEGLEMEVVFTRSSVKQMQELKHGGIYDLGHQAIDHIIRAVEAGSDLVSIFGISKPNYSLIVGADIKSYSDLHGKKLGVDGVATGFSLLLKRMMLKNGLIEGKDYELVQIGGTGERYQAILNGEVAGALLDGPTDLKAEANGLGRLGSNLDYFPKYQGTVGAIKRSDAEKNADKLVRYIRAYIRSTAWLYNTANKDEAVQILVDHLKAEQEIAAKTYDRYFESKTYNPNAEIDFNGVIEVMKVMADTGEIDKLLNDPAKYCDFTFLKQALAANTRD